MANTTELFDQIVKSARQEFNDLLASDPDFEREWKATDANFAEWFTDLYLDSLLTEAKLK